MIAIHAIGLGRNLAVILARDLDLAIGIGTALDGGTDLANENLALLAVDRVVAAQAVASRHNPRLMPAVPYLHLAAPADSRTAQPTGHHLLAPRKRRFHLGPAHHDSTRM